MPIRKFIRKCDKKVVEAVLVHPDIDAIVPVLASWIQKGEHTGSFIVSTDEWIIYDGVNSPYVATSNIMEESYEPFQEAAPKTKTPVAPKTEGLTFGEALELVKQGFAVTRKGWNGKNQFIYLITGQELANAVKYGYGEYAGEPTIQSAIAIKTSVNLIQVGWVASQSDMLSNDWSVVHTPR